MSDYLRGGERRTPRVFGPEYHGKRKFVKDDATPSLARIFRKHLNGKTPPKNALLLVCKSIFARLSLSLKNRIFLIFSRSPTPCWCSLLTH
jgi:hypothetical protein